MNSKRRQIGGESGKRGSRYEDMYTLYRLIEFLPTVLSQSLVVQFKEQAGCYVDDLLIIHDSKHLFHQIKADKTVTWGQKSSKLKKEFRSQKQQCEKDNLDFRLFVVVGTQNRFDSLVRDFPKPLQDCTEIIFFPEITKPFELLLRPQLIDGKLTQLGASVFRPSNEFRSLVQAIFFAWLDFPQTPDGFVDLSELLNSVRQSGYGKVRCDWVESVNWAIVVEILQNIEGLRWTTERGYFEWEYKGFDWGILDKPCQDVSFQRFMGRIMTSAPKTFASFVELLP